MKISTLLLSLASLGCASVFSVGSAGAHAQGTPASAGSVDSVTVTVAWTLTNTTTNKDAIGSFAIYNDQGFYQYFTSAQLGKFSSTRQMPVRVPAQGSYTMIMHYTNKRPAASTMKKYIIREKVALSGDTVMSFKGSECTYHLGLNYTLPGGVPLKFMYKASGKPDDWSEATATRATFQSILIAKDQPRYNMGILTSVQNGSSALGNDRAKVTDIYFNPGISDNFVYAANAIVVMVDTADSGHGADLSQPLVIISHQQALNTGKKETSLTNSGDFKIFTPDTIRQSLYPVRDAATRWGYRACFLDTQQDVSLGSAVTGSVYNPDGKVACDLAPAGAPLMLTMHQYETTKVRFGCVESGSGIGHMPLYIASGAAPVMMMEGNIGQGYAYNTLGEDLLFHFKAHPFYSYDPAEQKPDYGNSAPFMAFTTLASAPASAYTFRYPMSISNAEWVGNAGERRCVDLLSEGIAVVAGNDTIATEWGKLSAAIAAFEKTDHDPTEIRMIFDNTNFRVDNLPGHSRAVFSYRENDNDICPPTLTMLRIQHKNGRITNKFTNLSDADIYFNAGDFYHTGSVYCLYSSPVTVKVEIASRESERYTELGVEDYAANTAMPTWGNGYKIDLGQYSHTNSDGWFKLRFTLTDGAGNKCVQTISPALYASSAATGVAQTPDSAIGVELQGDRLLVRAQSPAEVMIFNLGGARVLEATGSEFDLSSLGAGVYMVRAAAGGVVVTEKIMKR